MKLEFKEWIDSTSKELAEFNRWLALLKNRIFSSISLSKGYISISIGSLNYINEVTEKGWKGKAALNTASSMNLNWSEPNRNKFSKAMNAGIYSIPQLVGRELGLLFEIEIFTFIIKKYKLKTIGKNLLWATSERTRIINLILVKLGSVLGKLASEFIESHAIEMGDMIFQKAKTLINECGVDSIEFTGGNAGDYSINSKSDTADLRIGCSKYISGIRDNIGFSLKAVTETRVEVRSLTPLKTLSLMGATTYSKKDIKNILNNPLYENSEKRESLLNTIYKSALAKYNNKPRKFAKLLELLVTGGADTIPAYRNLLGNSSPGWSNTIGKDFVTKEGPGSKLSAKNSSTVEVKVNSTYVKITYMVTGGNHYGTSIQFEPNLDGSKISAVVSNLSNRND